jgi:hypothetical protein
VKNKKGHGNFQYHEQEKDMNATAEKKREFFEKDPTFTIGSVAPKRIWADCSARDFNSFRDRAKAEGFITKDGKTDIATVLQSLVMAYAHGEVILSEEHKVHKERKNLYLESHEKRND